MTVFHGVVVGRFGEVNLARFPERLFAFLLLTWKKFCHEGVMALGYILVPTLFNLKTDSINIVLQVQHTLV